MFQFIWTLFDLLRQTSLETGFIAAVAVYLFCHLVRTLLDIPFLDDAAGKYVLVTGCDSGFGHHLALKLDGLGCNVIAACLTDGGAHKLKEASGRINTVILDVTDHGSVVRAKHEVEEILDRQSKGLWALVNNAGIIGNLGLSEWCSKSDLLNPINVNAMGMVEVTNAFLPLLRKEQGRIVNMASVAGRFAAPFSVTYTMSKYLVEAYSDVLRREMKIFGIGVHIIEPGATTTTLIGEDNITRTAKAVWDRAPDSVKSVYGQDYLQKALKMTMFLTNMTRTESIQHVLDAYTHAVMGKYPRIRYTVGLDAHLYIFLAKFPDWMSDLLFTTLRMPPSIPRH